MLALLSRLALAQAPEQEAPPTPPRTFAHARLDVGYALSSRQVELGDDAIAVSLGGFAPSHLRLSGAVFLSRLPVGAAADLALEWFSITGKNLVEQEETLALRGARASVALAGRLGLPMDLFLEGHLGYGFGSIPTVDASTGRLRPIPVRHHGPLLAAVLQYVPEGPWALQLSGRALPFALGGETALGPVRVGQYGLGAQAALGDWRLYGFAWALLLDYELGTSSGEVGSARLAQTSHRVGLGLRASLPRPARSGPPRADVPGSIRGRTLDASTQQPVPGLSVAVAGGPTVLTDAEGAFVVHPVALGPVELTTRGGGYRADTRTVDVPPGEEVSVTLELSRPTGPGRIRGKVRLAGQGAKDAPPPALDALIESPGASPVRTAPDGTFVLEGVGPGPVEVSIKAEGYRTADELVSVPPEGEATLELVLEKATRKAMAAIRGQLRMTTGKPIAMGTVQVEGARLLVNTERDGRFRLSLPGGRYTLIFSAPGYVTQSKVVEVADGDQALFYVDLFPLER